MGAADGVHSSSSRPAKDRLWRERLEWSDRLILITLSVSPLAALAFAWMFHDTVSGEVLVGWTAVLIVSTVVAGILSVRAARAHRASAPTSLGAGGQLAAIIITAVVFALPPWLMPSGNTTASALALLFPVCSITIAVVVFAAVRRWFLLYLTVVATPTLVWAARAGEPFAPAFLCLLAALVGLTLLLHREVHRLVVRSLTMKLRNEALVVALRTDQERIELANLQLAEANNRLLHQAGHDSLTGVLNRRGLEQRLEQFLTESRIADRHVVVLFCDLDRFKVVNDSLGHAAGDQLLCTAADRISRALPDAALLARLGGDEFVAVVSFPYSERDPDKAAVKLADEVRVVVAQPVSFEDREFVVTTTVGVAVLEESEIETLDVLRQADRALHYAKDAGRNRVELFGDGLSHVLNPRRLDEGHSVRTAIENGDIVPRYQPIVDADTGRVVSAELLARWIAPDGRLIRARDFIGSANDSGLVERMSEVLIARSLADLEVWEKGGIPASFRIGVNLPPRFVSRTARVSSLMELLASCPADRITAEISEISVVDDLTVAGDRLKALRALGLLVSLDDFGTGTTSLSLLQHMPIDSVKIDRSFVSGLSRVESQARHRALVAGFVGIATELGLSVTAEGVETTEQASILIDLGCRIHQGYLYADAVDADELLRLVHRDRLGPVVGAA